MTKNSRCGPPRIDLTGKRFGKITVIRFHSYSSNNSNWLCRCDCDKTKTKIIRGFHLRSGRVKSCGCTKSKVSFITPNGKSRLCSRCLKIRRLRWFGKCTILKDGYKSLCKECEYIQNTVIRYGVDKEMILNMIKKQNSKCPVCDLVIKYNYNPDKPLSISIDHCHNSGKVRGVLHQTCNLLVGVVESNLSKIEPIKRYLRKHK